MATQNRNILGWAILIIFVVASIGYSWVILVEPDPEQIAQLHHGMSHEAVGSLAFLLSVGLSMILFNGIQAESH